jgi:hypothetical protein
MAKATTNNGAMIAPCTCRNAGQDALHGKGNRLFSFGLKSRGKGPGWTCTVCGRFRSGTYGGAE